MKGIRDQDYEHAQQVWNIREKKTLGCYHDTYLKTDVLLLADVFETFQNMCLNTTRWTQHIFTPREIGIAGLVKDSRRILWA